MGLIGSAMAYVLLCADCFVMLLTTKIEVAIIRLSCHVCTVNCSLVQIRSCLSFLSIAATLHSWYDQIVTDAYVVKMQTHRHDVGLRFSLRAKNQLAWSYQAKTIPLGTIPQKSTCRHANSRKVHS